MQSTVSMHKYVLGLVGIFFVLVATFPIALIRVSQTPHFAGSHLKSLPLSSHNNQ